MKDWTRSGVEGQTNQTPPPKFLAVHEFAHLDAFGPNGVAVLHTPWEKQINDEVVAKRTLRRFQFHKKWERK